MQLQVGQAVEVTANGSPFYGERGRLVEAAMDAERCVVVAFEHIARVGEHLMAPVPFTVRLPLDHLSVHEAEPLASVEAPAPPAGGPVEHVALASEIAEGAEPASAATSAPDAEMVASGPDDSHALGHED